MSVRSGALTLRLDFGLTWGTADLEGGRAFSEAVLLEHGGFRRVAALGVKHGDVFEKRVKLGGSRTLRARVGGQSSPTWKPR